MPEMVRSVARSSPSDPRVLCVCVHLSLLLQHHLLERFQLSCLRALHWFLLSPLLWSQAAHARPPPGPGIRWFPTCRGGLLYSEAPLATVQSMIPTLCEVLHVPMQAMGGSALL